MDCILKYSGEDRDYFLTIDPCIKPYEYIVHKFHCKDQPSAEIKKQEIFDMYLKLGLIIDRTHGLNKTHLTTTNRDIFRMYVLKEYKVDMVSVERKMNLTYMSTVACDDSDELENSDEEEQNKQIYNDSYYSSSEKSSEHEEAEYEYLYDEEGLL